MKRRIFLKILMISIFFNNNFLFFTKKLKLKKSGKLYWILSKEDFQ
jgi:hypothetical protein